MGKWMKTSSISAKRWRVERGWCRPTMWSESPTMHCYRTPPAQPVHRSRSCRRRGTPGQYRRNSPPPRSISRIRPIAMGSPARPARLSPSTCLPITRKLLTILRCIRKPVKSRCPTPSAPTRRWTSRRSRCRRYVSQISREVGSLLLLSQRRHFNNPLYSRMFC